MNRGVWLLGCSLTLLGCRPDAVATAEAALSVDPLVLHLSAVTVGATSVGTVRLTNTGRVPLDPTPLTVPPFSVEPPGPLAPGASRALRVAFTPEAVGDASAPLAFSSAAPAVTVKLLATGLARPVCAPSRECVDSAVDVTSGACVESARPDGTACGAGCLVGGQCRAGECEGTPVDCDDQNRCTADACGEPGGCRHDDVSSECPRPGNPCQRAACDPSTGCGVVDAPDGTACGPNDCSTAHVCLAGTCVERPSPDGSECGGGTLCQAPSRCAAQVCVASPLTPLGEAFRYEVPGRALSFEGTVDQAGNVYAVERGTSAASAPGALVSLDAAGVVRYRVELPELPCASCGARLLLDPPSNRVFLGQWGRVEARRLDDGALQWLRDTTAGRALRSPQPDGGGSFSSVELLTLGGHVVEVLSEGYQLHRQYAVALDPATGQPAWERDWWGHLYGPNVGGDGHLWATHGDCWGPIVGSDLVGGNGANAGQRSDARYALATSGAFTLAYGNDGKYVWSGPGGDGPAFVLSGGMSWPQAVADARGAVILGGYSPVARAVDLDGGVRWTRVLRGSPISATRLSDGGVLVAVSLSDGGSSVARLGDDGEVAYDCPLPGSSSDGVVAPGRYVTVMGGALVGFELPGAAASASGWSTFHGTPWNDHRAH